MNRHCRGRFYAELDAYLEFWALVRAWALTRPNWTRRYRVVGHGGVAFYALGYVLERDEDFEWSGVEWEDRSRLRMVMVGDDRRVRGRR